MPDGVGGWEEKLRLNMPGIALSPLGLRFQNGFFSPSLKYPLLRVCSGGLPDVLEAEETRSELEGLRVGGEAYLVSVS